MVCDARLSSNALMRPSAWSELHARRLATQALMGKIEAARAEQVKLLRTALDAQEKQMARIEQLSTELWRCWQILLAAGHGPATTLREARV